MTLVVSSFNGIEKVDTLINDFDSIRIVLYLDKYNPNVDLNQLEKALKIERTSLAKTMDVLIRNEFVITENDKFRLSKFGKITTQNLKDLV